MKVNKRFDVVPSGQKFLKEERQHGYYYDEEQKKRVFGYSKVVPIFDNIQANANESDLDFIKREMLKTTDMPLGADIFNDVSDMGDLLDSFNNVDKVTNFFKSLPLSVREKFGNDVYRFASEFKVEEFMQSSKNKEIEDNENE